MEISFLPGLVASPALNGSKFQPRAFGLSTETSGRPRERYWFVLDDLNELVTMPVNLGLFKSLGLSVAGCSERP